MTSTLLVVFVLSILICISYSQEIASTTLPFTIITSGTKDEFSNQYFVGQENGNAQIIKTDQYFTPIWTFSFGGIYEDKIQDVTYVNGVVIICGISWSPSYQIGPTFTFNNIGPELKSIFLVALNATDGSVLWAEANSFKHSYFIEDTVIQSNAEYIFLAGNFFGTLLQLGVNCIASSYPFGGSDDFYVAKFHVANGSCIWAQAYGSGNFDGVHDMTIDRDGDIYLTGYYGDYSSFGCIPLIRGIASPFIIKVNGTENGQVIWSKCISSDVHRAGFALSYSDALYVTGTYSAAFSFDSNCEPLFSVGDAIYGAKLHGTNGNCIWSYSFKGFYFGDATSVGFRSNYGTNQLQSDGNSVVVVASTGSSAIQISNFAYFEIPAYSYVVIQMNAITGQIIWKEEYQDRIFSMFFLSLNSFTLMFASIVKWIIIPPSPLISINQHSQMEYSVILEFTVNGYNIADKYWICFDSNQQCVSTLAIYSQDLYRINVTLPSNTYFDDFTLLSESRGTLSQISNQKSIAYTIPSAPQQFLLYDLSQTSVKYQITQSEVGNAPFWFQIDCQSVPIHVCQNVTITNSTNGKIDLIPNTKYSFSISTLNDRNTSKTISASIESFTTIPLTISKFEFLNKTTSVMKLSVLDRNVNSRKLKVCQVPAIGKASCITMTSAPIIYLYSLIPSMRYRLDISVVAIDNIIESAVTSLTVTTPPLPAQVTLSQRTIQSIVLNIQVPSGQGNFTNWIFNTCVLQKCIKTIATPTSGTVSFDGLQSGTQYTFTVTTTNANQEQSVTIASFNTLDAPTNLSGLFALLLFVPIFGLLCLILLLIPIAIAIIWKMKSFKSTSQLEEDEEPLNIEMYEQLIKDHSLDFDKLEYQSSEILGAGSQASVFKAKYYGIPVAAKIYLLSHFGVKTDLKDFEMEAKFLSEYSKHPNIVRFIGIAYSESLNRIALVTELCQRGSLAKELDSHSLEWNQKLSILIGVASGMNYLHLHQILHRDLKCENILLDRNLSPKIIDFGLSKKIELVMNQSTNMTMNIGTAAYMAPEILLNSQGQTTDATTTPSTDNSSTETNQSSSSNDSSTKQSYDSKVDVYSFAIIMWCVLHNSSKPYGNMLSDIEIVSRMSRFPTMRPNIDMKYQYEEEFQWYIELMKQCYTMNAMERPTFEQILTVLQQHLE